MEHLKVYKALERAKNCTTCAHVMLRTSQEPCVDCEGCEHWAIKDEIRDELTELLKADEMIKAMEWFKLTTPSKKKKAYILQKYRIHLAEQDMNRFNPEGSDFR